MDFWGYNVISRAGYIIFEEQYKIKSEGLLFKKQREAFLFLP